MPIPIFQKAYAIVTFLLFAMLGLFLIYYGIGLVAIEWASAVSRDVLTVYTLILVIIGFLWTCLILYRQWLIGTGKMLDDNLHLILLVRQVRNDASDESILSYMRRYSPKARRRVSDMLRRTAGRKFPDRATSERLERLLAALEGYS